MASWDLADIHCKDESGKLLKSLAKKTKRFSEYAGLPRNVSVKRFMSAIRDLEELTVLSSRLTSYAALKLAQDTSDPEANSYYDSVMLAATNASNDTLFFSTWFKELDDKNARRLIKSSGSYRYMLETHRRQSKHMLETREEQIINVKDLTGEQACNRTYDLITNSFAFNFSGSRVQVQELDKKKMSSERWERKTAYDLILGRYGERSEVLGQAYRALVNDYRSEHIGLRGYMSPISVRNKANDLPDETVSSLLKSVEEHAPLFRKYYRLKARVLGLESMDRYDLYTPYREPGGMGYRESVKAALKVYDGFDERFGNLARKVFDRRHVDYAIRKGKQSGAFCMSPVKGVTPYVLLNHSGRIDDLYALVHELGHAIHSMLAKNQTEFTYHPSIPLAENASLFGEALLTEHLMAVASEDEQATLLVRSLDHHCASIARQTYFTSFELLAHERIPSGATVEELKKEYLKILRKHFAKSVRVPSVFSNEWLSIPHIYGSPFYCYSYAFADLAVLSLFRKYRLEGDAFKDDYACLLSLGGSKAPTDALRVVGVDVSSENVWSDAFKEFSAKVKLLDSIT